MATEDPCYAVTSGGVGYREFSCVIPSLERFYFEFEKKYDPIPVLSWMQNHSVMPITAVILYAVFMVVGRTAMKNRQAWSWRNILAVWNLSLSVFSWIGMFRTAPQLIYNLTTMSLRDNMCLDPQMTYGSGSSGLWVQLFILSKFPELFDTFFIVIHKKPLIFLHWYHHITVLLYCWHSYVTTSPPGLFFVVMNYSVHASMYGYYFLMAMKLRPKWFNPIIITAFQISQMIIGVAVTVIGFYYYSTDETCKIESENNTAAFVMYGSYLFLFMQFFIGRYFKGKVQVVKPIKKTV
eukprot:CAMPEP_0198281718 /NCGR_PEP_ID=MMETSP1449-20131203/1614_1 /TAXON_ID=420275 /ORGANISM="Attheya septentrionalis, Strain CCMP2084" /LENGTH=293 /DNA_ID=CAMNT_0043977619 /DNA_START=64 /DNA_END=945 /DNA_ORIENTATION=+